MMATMMKTMTQTIENKLNSITNGKDADENKIIQSVLSQIQIPKIEEIEANLPKLGAEVRDGLELLKEDDRLDISAIKGIDELKTELKESGRTIVRGGGGPNANAVQYADLTSQCNGTLKTFVTPKYRTALMLISTQFPNIYRPVTDFTLGNGAITLTSEVSAPATSQTLIFLYVK